MSFSNENLEEWRCLISYLGTTIPDKVEGGP